MPPRQDDIAERLARHNAGREAERLALKYDAMRQSLFTFYRGSASLFWEDARAGGVPIPEAPRVWGCGDLHLENFGSYRGGNGLAYFDLNDFDGAALAPVTWELARFLTSIHVAAPSLNLSRPEATELAKVFLSAYGAALANGKALWIERATATGMVHDLLRQVRRRTHAELVESRTRRRGGRRVLRAGGRHALPLSDAEGERWMEPLRKMVTTTIEGPEYELLDVARRVAGVGSLGVQRFVLLVERDRGPERRILIDVKQAVPSPLARNSPVKQPHWRSEAERMVQLQQRMQAVAPALLHAAVVSGESFVVRELQPTEDRLLLSDPRVTHRRMHDVLSAMGQLTAWAHLRSGGRDGSATADALITFGRARAWHAPLLAYARRSQRVAERAWQQFGAAYDAGRLDPSPTA